MATITGLTAERMLEIEAASVIDGAVVGGNLILEKHDGSQINAGSVVGPPGPEGPVGSDLTVVSAKPVLDVGLIDQIRAGRQLGAADFANIGLSAPAGLWTLANLTDTSGFGRNLLNKGSVGFASGINGVASTAALFTGATTQALYIADTGAADPFRIKTGSIGAWFRTGKSGVYQSIITKRGAAGTIAYSFSISSNNVVASRISDNGTTIFEALGQSLVCDDHWHFAVMTYDGSLHRVYVDGVLEGSDLRSFPIFASASPFNIGGFGADGSVVAAEPHFGRIGNGFVTSDILTEDQVRNLYCAKIPHTLGAIPSRVTLNIRRRRRGAALVVGDFPSVPGRLYNFSAGSLGNEGAAGVSGDLTGTAIAVAGVDGSRDNAMHFSGAQRLTSTDTDLPSGLASVTYGCWMKTNYDATTPVGYLMTYGTTISVNDNRLYIGDGKITFGNASGGTVVGPYLADGAWHLVVVVQDNGAIDGVKRKLYVDGRLVASSLVMTSIVLGGANKFVIGSALVAGSYFVGDMDTVFVSSIAFTLDDITKLYMKGSQTLAASPKNVGDHIEALTATDLLATFDTLDGMNQVDLKVTT